MSVLTRFYANWYERGWLPANTLVADFTTFVVFFGVPVTQENGVRAVGSLVGWKNTDVSDIA